MSLDPLKKLYAAINAKSDQRVEQYVVPARWIDPYAGMEVVAVQPYEMWAEIIGRILTQSPTPRFAPDSEGGDWSRYGAVYNLFVRSGAAFDHDADGTLAFVNRDGLRETGTFTKAICLLPYIQSLGCNTVHLLPITKIGTDGKKGDAGSPYAIRNHYEVDENLAEPSLGIGADAEFAAFVAAAHHLGMRVVCEFILRTAARDADIVAAHPEWFYWIDATVPIREHQSADESAFGLPLFTHEEEAELAILIEKGDRDNLIPPHDIHRAMFLPIPDEVVLEGGRWVGRYANGKTGRIAPAFTDWPIGDHQPPWRDVTYLRLYDHPDFNYTAYNTLRIYDNRLAQPQNAVEPLWEYLSNIVPYYQQNFGIDGALIDMGHALPAALKKRMVKKARSVNSDFAFWDENFFVGQVSRDEGYNVVMGSLASLLGDGRALQAWLGDFMACGRPIYQLGSAETHNTHRAISLHNSVNYAKFAFAICAFLPVVPFIHNGFEFGETRPANTGIGFSQAEIAALGNENLSLFSAIAFDWANGDPSLAKWIRHTLALRDEQPDLYTQLDPDTMGPLMSDNPAINGILRRDQDWTRKFALLYNIDMHHPQEVWMALPTGREFLKDRLTDQLLPVSNSWVNVQLKPAQLLWLEL
jgi:hypothetical protein